MKQFLGKSPSGLFATQTLTGHVIRGAVAFALLYLAIEQQHLHPVASLLAGLLALVAMRGCPVCWTIGLVETIRQYRSGATNRMINWIFALVLSLSGAGTLLAQDAPVREKVSFAAATVVDGGVTVNGELRIPAVSGAKLPAVVVIHGSGGLQDGVGTRYVEALNQAGIATLELDLFPRAGRPETPRFNFPHTYGSLIYLAKHPRIDPARIGVMGFSWGGALSLISATGELTRTYTGGAYRFAAHLPVYPVCWPHSAILQGKNRVLNASIYQAMTGSPVHILAGAIDDFDDDPDACPKFIQALPASVRSYVTVTVYPDVGHGFDLPKSEERTFKDPFAHMGHGGTVRYYGDAATADRARAFAAEFFKSNLETK